jgi:hypothetical protein
MATPTAPRDVDLTALHDALPLSDPDRHDLENPALEAAFRHQAADHADAITYDPNWTPGGAQ